MGSRTVSSAGYVEGLAEMGAVRGGGGVWGCCGPACREGGGVGCDVTAQPSLDATDKAARHGRQLIPTLLNY